jgi:hypothetical protein
MIKEVAFREATSFSKQMTIKYNFGVLEKIL